jgi:Type ISP C-terminal specificity domain/N-6 DNA Methylase
MDTTTMIVGALDKFAEDLTASFALAIPGQPEDQLKGPVSTLLAVVGNAFGLKVATKTESVVAGLGARPDLGVAVDGLLTGHIELKAPGFGARPDKFKGENKKQWEKFKSLPNLIYTDGNEWSLYRTGVIQGTVVRFAGDVTADGHNAITDANVSLYDALLRNFLGWTPLVPASPRDLAELLAPLCRLLRTDVLAAVRKKGSALSILAGEWRTYLFPEADDFQFADAYAQTLTYALLLARFEGVTDLRSKAADALDTGHGLLAQVLRVLGQPAARAEIEIPVDLLERSIVAVDPTAVAKRGDPWLYFYEDFLAAYDEKLRKNRGVYYTPAQVVSTQVELVTELLTTNFSKTLGMADDDVTVLDPGVGTGTYLLAALQRSLTLVADRYGPGAVASRATKAGENLHGFELLVGPYAVAHLRLSEAILTSGGQLPTDGAHIYLTDTLDAPSEPTGQLTLDLLHRRLSEENKRAREIKAHKRVLVCIGNPPYYRQAIEPSEVGIERQGGWVRYGDRGDDGILNDFLAPVVAAGMGVHAKNLYNLYVYFWRWALWKVFDTTADAGIVSFISASSYLRGPGFLGMREVMRRTFDELWILDLEGDNLGARRTENVFAIQNPVAIAIGVRYGLPKSDVPATVRYSRLTGSREEKLAALAQVHRFADLEWKDCYTGWHEPLIPVQSGDYFSWPLITDLFPWQHAGVQWKRTWPIAPVRSLLVTRWMRLVSASPTQKAALFREAPSRLIDRSYSPAQGMDSPDSTDPLPPLKDATKADQPEIVRYGYRTLDRQWVLSDSRLADRPRPPLWAVHSNKQIYMTSLLTGILGLGPAVSVSADVPDLHHFRGSFGGKDTIPLWRDHDASAPNITTGLLDVLSRGLGRPIIAEEVFSYAYGVLSSPAYVERFSEELTIPGPRLPITTDPEVFDRAARLGSSLIWLHTFGERSLKPHQPGEMSTGKAKSITPIPGDKTGYPESASFDAASETLYVGEGAFAPVSREVWEFSVSGFQPVKSWIAHRLAHGAGRKSSLLDEIRPEVWTAEIEKTVAMQDALDQCLTDILTSKLFTIVELPSPIQSDRRAPRTSWDDPDQGILGAEE